MQLRASIQVFLLSYYGISAHARIDERNFSPAQIIERDVVIIGGGASGTYAAVRLREDLNTSIVVIEPKNRLGGHVDTYKVPETNTTLEYGVQSYMQYGPSVGFFERFGVQLGSFSTRQLKVINVDVETGKALNYTAPSAVATFDALKKWQQFVEKYNDLVEPGYWNFPEPGQIPQEFLLPFADFVKQNGIEAAVPRIAVISGVGVGSLSNIPTMHVVQAFGAPVTKAAVEAGFVQPLVSNSLLYQRAYNLLKDDVFLSSTIRETERGSSGIRLVIQSSTKEVETLIKAKQVLWTPFPSQDNLRAFDQDTTERQVFESWEPSWSYVGVAKIPCIPENSSITYLPQDVVPSNHIAIRDYPYSLSLGTTGPSGQDLFRVMLSANFSMTYAEAKAKVHASVQKLISAGTLNHTGPCKVDIKALSSHNGVSWPQEVEILESGFVQKLFSLQGRRHTWWTGRSWCGEYSSNVWTFTDTVLERLVRSLV
ncbi:hypothetical protein DM02DRAFT_670413 [Periconia macrospinosa]|uniref:FAD/NAD(P)-binding domain-containing protein n=1 Tax=Periconia macrospinosa TaxID=97972 RepID=A0A2V1DZB2_9PLEO|nr:hypothetical protein DM02DRAFT_670413 [Periconia macrospinosa]